MKSLLILFLLATVALPARVQAALIAYDGFETQTIGNLGGQTGGSNWTAPTWTAITSVQVAAGGLNYNNGAISINGGAQAAQFVDNANSDSAVSRSFPAQTGTVYFSFLFTAPTGLEMSDFLGFQLNNDTLELSSGTIGLRNNAGNPFFARISSSSDTQAQNANSAVNANSTDTFLLVGKLSHSGGNYNRMDLFVNPSSLTEPGTPTITATANTGINSVSMFNVRNVNLDSGDLYRFDELKIGTTFASVVTPIPEPSGVLLALSGVAGLVYWRRRAS